MPDFKYRVIQAGSGNVLGGFHKRALADLFAEALSAPGGRYEGQLLKVQRFYPRLSQWIVPREEA